MKCKKTVIHFRQEELVEVNMGFGKKKVPKTIKRTLEVEGYQDHSEVLTRLKDAGYNPVNGRVMLEYV